MWKYQFTKRKPWQQAIGWTLEIDDRMVEQVMEFNDLNSGNLVEGIKTQASNKQQEWLALWAILSGETNIWERKQNKHIDK